MHLPRGIADLSLVDGWLHATLLAGGLLSLAGLLLLRRSRAWWTRAVPAAVGIAAVLLWSSWFLVERSKSWPDGFPSSVLAWAGSGLLGLTVLVLGWRRQHWWVRALAVGGATLLLLADADAIDSVYGSFPTVATALQLPPYDAQTSLRAHPASSAHPRLPAAGPLWQSWRPPAGQPDHGAVFQAKIPPTRSHFAARPAWIYLPPAAVTARPPKLPLLLLISGQPGGPRDWLDGGGLAQRMDAWAAAHHGLAPIVVMPDALGSELANPLCMDSDLGRTDTYLAQDVPAWATRTLGVDPNSAHWAVGGFSFGGTCALQLAVAHPALFPTFLDVSGQQSPTLGSRAKTVAATFRGNQAAFTAVDPLAELRARRYPGSAGYLLVGARDVAYRRQALVVTASARAAGMSIRFVQVPAGHNWSVWRQAAPGALSWLGSRMALTP